MEGVQRRVNPYVIFGNEIMEFGLLSAGRPDSSYCNYGSISIPKKLTNDVSKAARFALMMMEGLIGAVLPPDSTICDQRGKRVTSQKHLAIVPVSKPNLLSILLGSRLRFGKRLGVWTMLLHLFLGGHTVIQAATAPANNSPNDNNPDNPDNPDNLHAGEK